MAEKENDDIFAGKLTDKQVEDLFYEVYAASKEVFTKRKRKWSKLIAAYGSEFLDEDEKRYLRDTDRPPVELNLITAKINAIRGSMMSQRQEVQFKPHTSSSTANVLGGWMTTLVRKAMNDCEGHRQQEAAFFNNLCTGYGAVEVYLDTSRIPFRGTVKRVRLHELWPDPDASETCLMDRADDKRVREWLVEQVIARWPKKRKQIIEAVQQLGTFSRGGKKRSPLKKEADSLRGRVKVAEFQYQRWMPRVRWYDPERGERRDTTPEELKARRKELAADVDAAGVPRYQEIVEEEYRGETWFRAYLLIDAADTVSTKAGARTGTTVLEHEESPRVGSTIQWVTGLEKDDPERNQVEFFNLLSVVYGLQMVLNRTIQEELAILAREAKGGVRYTEDAVPDNYPGGEAQWIKDQSRPGGATKVAAGMMDQIQDKELPRIPSGLDRLEQKLVDWIGQAMAITDAFVGSVQEERSSVYLSNLQAQGMITLGPVLDPYVVFIKNVGVALAQILIRHLPTADIDRLLDYPEVEGLTHQRPMAVDPETGESTGEEDPEGELEPIMVDDPDAPVMDPETGEQAVDPETMEPLYEQVPVTAGMILKQEDPLDYECIVDTGQATTSLRYALWEMFEQGILQTLQNALPAPAFQKVVLLLIRNLPVPGEQGKKLESDIEAAIEQEADLQTEQGVQEYLTGLGPEKAQGILAAVAQALGLPAPGEPPEGKPVSKSISFKDLPPDGQVQLAAQAGLQIAAPPPAPVEPAEGGAALPQ